MAWYRQVKGADWATPAEVKRAIRSTSILKDAEWCLTSLAINIASWRGSTTPYRLVYIRFIGTHRRDAIDAQTV